MLPVTSHMGKGPQQGQWKEEGTKQTHTTVKSITESRKKRRESCMTQRKYLMQMDMSWKTCQRIFKGEITLELLIN